MNKIYKLVWNASTGCWSVASEFARKGKPGRGTRCLMLATGLLAVSGIAVADCQDVTNGTGATLKTITCTGDITGPYKIKTPDTTLTVQEGSKISFSGKGNAGPEVLGNESGSAKGQENNAVINNGIIEWNNAQGKGGRDIDAAVMLNYRGNNIQKASFLNGESGKVIVNTTSTLATNQLAAVSIYAYGGTPVIDNKGEVSIKNPETTAGGDGNFMFGVAASGGKSARTTNTGTITVSAYGGMSGNALYSSANKGNVVIDNAGKIIATATSGESSAIAARVADGDSVITNSGILDATSSGVDSGGILVFAADTVNSVMVNNSGHIYLKGGTEEKNGRAGILLSGQGNKGAPVNTIFKVTNTDTGLIDVDNFSNAVALHENFTTGGKFADSPVSVSIENAGTLKGGKAVSLYAGNDSFTQTAGTTTGDISMGDGNNTVTLSGGSVTGNTIAGKGNDSYSLTNNSVRVNGNISLGEGDNTFMLLTDDERPVDAPLTGNLTAGSGNDILAMKNMTVKGNVDLGDGNNVLVLDNSLLGLTGETETAATTANDDIPGNITTGNGDDVLTLSGVSSVRNISLGDGDNILAMSGAVIDGAVTTGSGDDTLIFVRDTDADTSRAAVPSNFYTVTNLSGRDISLGDGNNTVIMDRDNTFYNGKNSIVTGEGDDTFTISDGKFISNINAGDGKNELTLSGGEMEGDIATGSGNDMIFLRGGKYAGAISSGAGDDDLVVGSAVDISGLTKLDGGTENNRGDRLYISQSLTGSSVSAGSTDNVLITGLEDIYVYTPGARTALSASTLTLTGDLDAKNLNISRRSVLNLSDTTESATVKGNLINAGTIDLTRQSSPSQTLSVTGNYTGSDALLRMNTVWNAPGDALGGNSQSDLLDITGTASGNTTVIPVSRDGRENVIDGDVRQVNHVINTVPVVKVHTPGEERAFTGTTSTTGVSEVQLAKRTSNGVDEYFWTATAVETRDEGTQTDNNPRTDSGTQTDNSTRADSGTQTDNGTRTDNGTQTDNGNRTDNGTQTDNGNRADSGTQTDNSNSADSSTQTDDGERTDNSTQTDDIRTDSDTRTNNGTQTDNGTPVSPVTPSDKGTSGPQIYNSAVAGYVSMPRVNMEQGYSTVATLHERRGENMALAWNAATPADGQTWGRLLGEHLKQDGKTRLDVHTDTYGFQFGHDFRITRDE
ncbi:ESPR-type extended signal peptide-containing protein, partial [Escherichia coli]|uniref:ESPR-type extended signal peptide-containing protein n=1 Tax=Escherichia coli TaxID=562 RepID=UPI0030F3A682